MLTSGVRDYCDNEKNNSYSSPNSLLGEVVGSFCDYRHDICILDCEPTENNRCISAKGVYFLDYPSSLLVILQIPSRFTDYRPLLLAHELVWTCLTKGCGPDDSRDAIGYIGKIEMCD